MFDRAVALKEIRANLSNRKDHNFRLLARLVHYNMRAGTAAQFGLYCRHKYKAGYIMEMSGINKNRYSQQAHRPQCI